MSTTYMEGTSPEELLQGFADDVLGTAHSNGSDKRHIAWSYFNRYTCNSANGGFLAFLLKYGAYDRFIDTLENLRLLDADLAYYAGHPEGRRHAL